jgi:hypothetical protein
MRQMLHHPTYQMSDNDLRDHLLDTLEDLLTRRGSSINNFNLPIKCSDISPNSSNRLFDEELCYNTDIVMTESKNMTSQLNKEQCHAFNCIVNAVLSNKPGFFFVSGYGGTEKTYLWNTIISYLRAQKKIVLSVASSGVASLLLLVVGRHVLISRFHVTI